MAKDTEILQGINLEADASVVKINVKKTEDITKIMTTISNLHPVYLKSYEFTDKNTRLVVTTFLPYLWQEIGEKLKLLANNKLKYSEAKEEIIEKLMKQRTGSMSTIPVLYSAENKRLELTSLIIDKETINPESASLGYSKSFNRMYTVGCGRGSHIIEPIVSSKDSSIGKGIQRDKWVTNKLIERLQLPINKWEVLDSKEQIKEVWDKYQKPVVIKPTGLTQGKGVCIGIKTLKEAERAYDLAREPIDSTPRQNWQKKIMIQEQAEGEDYRIPAINGRYKIATKRIPAFIKGDGTHTIEELIEEENKNPRRDLHSPIRTLKPIHIDDFLLDYLKEQKLTLKSVPKEDQKVNLRKVASMSQGGITEDVTDEVCKEIQHVVNTIASSAHCYALGIDIICKDIKKPLTNGNGTILEINTMPEAYLNFYPVIGETREDVADYYLDNLLSECNTKRIVVIGNKATNVKELLRKKRLLVLPSYLKNTDTVGEYRNGDLTIDGYDISKEISKREALAALKINASLDAIILHHRNWEEVEQFGLGFNKIDILVVTKEEAQNGEYMRLIRKYRFNKLIKTIKVIG